MSRSSAVLITSFALVLAACSPSTGPQVAGPLLVPQPASIATTPGSLAIKPGTKVAADEALRDEVQRLLDTLDRRSGLRLELATEEESSAPFTVAVDTNLPAEGYRLETSSTGLSIQASTASGVFYAFQTLQQLLPPAATDNADNDRTEWRIPLVTIEDQPRFAYRGLHLDVGRHFFDTDFVKSMLDTMAQLKLNRFHWHLTEDQGWRIQIDAFPKLTEIGAWRSETQVPGSWDPYVGDGTRYGGFYTKAQIREVVEYASARHIQVIPEIEMPGHATAALAAYPEFGCTDERPEVETSWGIKETVFCPKEETFAFLFAVLDEVLELFPSKYIHIGGDEVPKTQWRESLQAQTVIHREGLANEDELQSYFIRRIEQHLNARGRNLIGWDEILEGGLAPNATVMTWRDNEFAVTAAQLRHDVIRTPHEHSYFDFYQGPHDEEPFAMAWAGHDITLETAYAFEPVPEELTAEEAAHILGGQANLWTEYINTPQHAEYMLYPRAFALAEVVWSEKSQRDWHSFTERLTPQLERLEHRGINYRWPKEVYGERAPTPGKTKARPVHL